MSDTKTEAQAVAVIKDVTGEIKNTSRGSGKLYTIQADGGPFKTWKDEVATAAFALKGQVAVLDYSDEQVSRDGRSFRNRWLNRVSAAPQNVLPAAPAGIPVSGGAPTAAAAPPLAAPPAPPAPLAAAPVPVYEDPAPDRMARSKATEVAARLLSLPELADRRTVTGLFSLADALVVYTQSGEHPTAPPTIAVGNAPNGQQPQQAQPNVAQPAQALQPGEDPSIQFGEFPAGF